MHCCKLLSLQGIASVRFWKSLQKLLKNLSRVSFCFLDIFQLPSASFSFLLPLAASVFSLFDLFQLPLTSSKFLSASCMFLLSSFNFPPASSNFFLLSGGFAKATERACLLPQLLRIDVKQHTADNIFYGATLVKFQIQLVHLSFAFD